MSRKLIITFAAAATLAVATLASSSSYARGFVGGHPFGRAGGIGAAGHARLALRGRSTLIPILNPGNPRRPGPPIKIGHRWHHHWHWVFRGGRWVEIVDIDSPVDVAPAVEPAPCNCLTKTYTPTGLVVFADICTKESASAPANDDHADAAQTPTTQVPATVTPMSQVPTAPNYAGRTYEDYLAANGQSAQPQASAEQN